jgi:hypothetical protein
MTTEKMEYRNRVKGIFKRFAPKIENAPAKRGWNRILAQPIASQMDLKRQRDAAIKDVIEEATLFGVNIDLTLKEDEEYESPFEKTTDE